MSSQPRHAQYALLDRDGTILVDKVYLSDPEEIEFTLDALEGMKLLRDAGFGLIVITNQSGVARGYLSEQRLAEIHAALRALLENEGINLEAIYYCPHGPDDNCRCRKPAPGMLIDAMNDFSFDARQAIVIGDSIADVAAAAAVGIKGIRIAPRDASTKGGEETFLTAARQALNHFRREVSVGRSANLYNDSL